MKKSIYIITTILCLNGLYGQIVYTENFNSYSVGTVGTDFTGTTPGKGGWLTECLAPGLQSNNLFNISSEPNKGNVLTLTAGTINPTDVSLAAKKIGLETLINQRTPGNNVLKFEIDYYTGAQQYGPYNSAKIIILSCDVNNNVNLANKRLFNFGFFSVTGQLVVHTSGVMVENLYQSILPFNTWFSFIVYLDYNNKKVYFEVPYLNTIAVADFLKTSTSTNLIEDFKPTTLGLIYAAKDQTPSTDMVNKYDNIKITALKSVPTYVLNTESFLATKFNLYPNPATNMVNITNAENMQVQQVTFYDITGKQLSTQSFNGETSIQLNIENLASGTYMLHLQTNAGTAVKKLVKN
ncbi:MAG: T9SS type A sorting domain-containing protein [Flavobacterium sp.]|uniref:T9SS type A sorting domain-containing protein n=1 Tax=Flavobacterium sp. TaxID=239 RepID=UPI002FC7B632